VHQIGRPLVADGVGGLAGLAAAAFGAVGGISPALARRRAVRSARLGDRLKIEDEKVAKLMTDVKSRLVRLRDALADLQAKEGTATRSRSPAFRGGARSISAVLGQ
jgi:hypothetical protein